MGGSPPGAGVRDGYPGASPPGTAHAGGSLRARLLAATHAEHARINRHPRLAGLTRPGYRLAQYRTLLPVYHRFYGLVEGAVLERLKADAVDFSYQERRKLPWLDQDLAVLGLSPPVLGAGPACRCADLAEAIGALYPIEGSTLGGQLILGHLRDNLGLTATTGARFFHGYGADTQRRWAEFLAFAERLVADPDGQERAARMAVQVFRLLRTLLDDETSTPGGPGGLVRP